jgi:NDP-sugar pyrophosphorylase family protein
MKAMILAAGLGTRLRPLTDTTPKALIPIRGKPLLYYLIQRLKKAGVSEIIINVHHHGAQIIEYFKQNNFDVRIQISLEKTLLDTGGGLKNAAWFFNDNQPFILHNVDVLSSIDLVKMMEYHKGQNVLATVAVKQRDTPRQFLFDADDYLVGWTSTDSGETILSRKEETSAQKLSFLGIHIISPKIFGLLPKDKIFSIIEAYLDLARSPKTICAYHCDDAFWFDLGKTDGLKRAEEYLISTES